MRARRSVYIVGAGIAGLALALGLAKFGLSVVVLERRTEIGDFGAGLQVSPNAYKALTALGLGDPLAATSFEPEGIDLFSGRGEKPLQTLVLGQAARDRYGAPYAVMHRGDLAQILFAAARRFANIDILPGVADFSVEAGETLSVTVTEADGKTRRARPFALIGADGVHSRLRTRHVGGPEADATGFVAWRALADPAALETAFDLRRTSVVLGGGFHVVVYPLPYRDAVNLVAFTEERRPEGREAPRLRVGRDRRLAAIMAAAEGRWTPWSVATVAAPSWHRGAIGLVGDAAHAMLPFQAQGAAMGIEDAAVLAPLLATAPDARHALSRYENLRRERVARVVAVSKSNGRIFHMHRPFSLARDMVIAAQGPLGHFRRLDWLYGHDPAGRMGAM